MAVAIMQKRYLFIQKLTHIKVLCCIEYFLNIAQGARTESDVSTIISESEDWKITNINGRCTIDLSWVCFN